MTDPERSDRAEHRMERTYKVSATPEEVWAAIATAEGISAWMLPTEMDPRVGGEMSIDQGEYRSEGVITGYDVNLRFAYEEPWPMTDEMREWVSSIVGAPPTDDDLAAVSPIATEFLVESASGGSCVLRVVTSAYGRGADWENEFFTEMVAGWEQMLDELAAHLNQPADLST